MASCSAKRRKFHILFFIQAQLLSSWISQSSAMFRLPSGRLEISLQNLLFQQIMAGAFLLVKADKKWHSRCKNFFLFWDLLYSVWMGFSFSFFSQVYVNFTSNYWISWHLDLIFQLFHSSILSSMLCLTADNNALTFYLLRSEARRKTGHRMRLMYFLSDE